MEDASIFIDINPSQRSRRPATQPAVEAARDSANRRGGPRLSQPLRANLRRPATQTAV
jgi:hypothetical protein